MGGWEQTHRARDLHAKSGVKEKMCGMKEIAQFQNCVNTRILVYNFQMKEFTYQGPTPGETEIML